MGEHVTEHDLTLQIDEVQLSCPKLKDHELFLAWFLRATITYYPADAADALTGYPHDKGADAVLIDDRAMAVLIIQSKYQSKVNSSTEPRTDVMSFANLACQLTGSDEDFKWLCDHIGHPSWKNDYTPENDRKQSLKLVSRRNPSGGSERANILGSSIFSKDLERISECGSDCHRFSGEAVGAH